MAKAYDQHLHDSLAYLGLPALASHSAWTPNTDVYETPDGLVVKLEIAGIEKDDLEITLNDRLLLVRGHRKDPCREKRCSFRQMEIDYGAFERRIVIPRSVDGSRVRRRTGMVAARAENGDSSRARRGVHPRPGAAHDGVAARGRNDRDSNGRLHVDPRG